MPRGYVKFDNILMREMIKKVGLDTTMFYLLLKSHKIASDAHCCYPSRKLLAEECNISIRTVARHIKALEDSGYLITNTGTEGSNNNYYFPREDFFKKEDVVEVSKRVGRIKIEDKTTFGN